jgi:hypothetical protein
MVTMALAAGPYLVTGNYANDGNQPVAFMVALDGGTEFEVAATTNPDGTVRLRYDVSGLSNGNHSAVVKSKNLWATSAAAPAFAFNKALPVVPTSVGLSAN